MGRSLASSALVENIENHLVIVAMGLPEGADDLRIADFGEGGVDDAMEAALADVAGGVADQVGEGIFSLRHTEQGRFLPLRRVPC